MTQRTRFWVDKIRFADEHVFVVVKFEMAPKGGQGAVLSGEIRVPIRPKTDSIDTIRERCIDLVRNAIREDRFLGALDAL